MDDKLGNPFPEDQACGYFLQLILGLEYREWAGVRLVLGFTFVCVDCHSAPSEGHPQRHQAIQLAGCQ